MKFGILLIAPSVSGDAERDFAELLEQAVVAEELGYDSVWVTEHHSEFGVVGSPAVLLAAIAMRTSRIRLGSMAAILPYHRPIHVAESYGLVDVLSGGRLEFGVGRGNLASELALHGVDPATSRATFWESLSIVRGLWGDGEPPHGLITYPRPVQHPVPIWIAANGLETARQAAELGLRIATSPAGGSILDYRRNMLAIRSMLEAGGHSPESMEFPLSTFDTYIATSPEQARLEFQDPAFTMHRLMCESGRRPLAAPSAEDLASRAAALGTSVVTDPPGAISFLRGLHTSVGLGHFVAATAQGGLDHALVLASMTLFAHEVMDAIRADEPHSGHSSGLPAGTSS
jgi:alkanesulfonate monooxygenase SsuD/methylene tetrahydromethanopterin reductase-like flavin-dependent oxidoreductase (luciferase family)